MLDFVQLADLVIKASLHVEGQIVHGADSGQLRNFVNTQLSPVPDDLIQWLKLCNSLTCRSGDLFGAATPCREMDIDHQQKYCETWNASGWIPIANDECGNFHAIVTRGEFGNGFPIVFFDTSLSQCHPDHLEASDLQHFLVEYLTGAIRLDGFPFGDPSIAERDPELVRFHGLPFIWD